MHSIMGRNFSLKVVSHVCMPSEDTIWRSIVTKKQQEPAFFWWEICNNRPENQSLYIHISHGNLEDISFTTMN